MSKVNPKSLIAMLQRFAARKEYNSLRKSCLKQVVEWRWATGLMLPRLPHEDTLFGSTAPRWVEKQPSYGHLHGLDEKGRIMTIGRTDTVDHDPSLFEVYFFHDDAGFWQVSFRGDDKRPMAVVWREVREGRLQHELSISEIGVREEVLAWKAGRLVQLVVRAWEMSTRELLEDMKTRFAQDGDSHTVTSYKYLPDGKLLKVVQACYSGREPKPYLTETKYERQPRGVTMQSLLWDVEELLVAEIPKAIRAAKTKDEMYCLVVQFSGVNTDPCGFAPPLLLVPEATRRRLIDEHGNKEAVGYLWNNPELELMRGTVSLKCKGATLDRKLKSIFRLMTQSKSVFNYTPLRKVIQRVCRRLNQSNWNEILRATDDFVAYPVHTMGLFDVDDDLRASVPKKRLQLLIDRGQLWEMNRK